MLSGDDTEMEGVEVEVMLGEGERSGGKRKEKSKRSEKKGEAERLEAKWAEALIFYRLTVS